MSVRLGNDEFILYIRKHYPTCSLPNDALGRRIWGWIQTVDPSASKTEEDVPCYWGDSGSFIAENRLPKQQHNFHSSVPSSRISMIFLTASAKRNQIKYFYSRRKKPQTRVA